MKALAAVVVAAAGFAIVSPARPAHAVDLPSVRIGDVTVIEGDAGYAVVNVPVDLSQPPTVAVTVLFNIVGVTATAGTDFVARHGKVSFPIGVSNRQVGVRVNGDTNQEPDRTIAINLSAPHNAVLDDTQGTVTIVDDDSDTSTALQVNIGDIEVLEANGGTHVAYVPITLSQPAPSLIKLHYTLSCGSADNGTDYVVKQSGTISFAARTQSKSLRFSIPANETPEEAVTFLDTISVVSGPAVVNVENGGGTIQDDDTPPGGPDPATLGVGEVGRVSVASDGSQSQFVTPGLCGGASPWGATGSVISADGRYTAFRSDAINLVGDDTNAEWDIYEHDRVTGATQRVSVWSDGTEAPANVGGAPYVGADSPAISADGRYTTFWSPHPLAAPATATSGGIYIHDRVTGQTELVSKNLDGSPDDGVLNLPSPVSADGRYVAFSSGGANLVTNDLDPANSSSNNISNGQRTYDIFLRDRVAGTTTLVTQSYDGTGTAGMYPAMNADGRFISFQSQYDNVVAGDTNGCPDNFVRDMTTHTTERVSVTTSGQQVQPATGGYCPVFNRNSSISADGSVVVFESEAWNLYPGISTAPAQNGNRHVFLRDLAAHTTQLIDDEPYKGGGTAVNPSVSADGQYVAYECASCGSDETISDVYDRATDTTTWVGQLPDGTIPDGPVHVGSTAAISGDGSFVVFDSWAANLIPNDDNDAADIYIQRLH